MRTYAAYVAFRLGTPTLVPTVFAGFPKASWKWVASSSAHTVAAEVALADTLDSSASWPLDRGLTLIGSLPEATLLRVVLKEKTQGKHERYR